MHIPHIGSSIAWISVCAARQQKPQRARFNRFSYFYPQNNGDVDQIK